MPKPLSSGFGGWDIIAQKSRIGGYNYKNGASSREAIIAQKSRIGGYNPDVAVVLFGTIIAQKSRIGGYNHLEIQSCHK